MSLGKSLLWLGLLLTVVAALWPLEEKTADGLATRAQSVRNRNSAPQSGPTPGSLRPAGSKPAQENEIVDLFPRQGWTPPAVASAPAPAVAPPLPFTFGGRYTEGTKIFIFLNEGAKMHTVRQGDTVNATYRIEKIDSGVIILTYLPLGLQQTLATGSTTPP